MRFAIAIGALALSAIAPPANALITFTDIYDFKGGTDGSNPVGALVGDGKGNLYGVTSTGGDVGGLSCQPTGCGTIFKLSPPASGKTQWTHKVLYSFPGGAKGAFPSAGLLFNNGSFFGVTVGGGSTNCGGGCGVVFQFSAATGYSVIHAFKGAAAGDFPMAPLTMNAAGDLYGTSEGSFTPGDYGTVFKLSPQKDSKTWDFTTIHAFTGGTDGASPAGPVSFLHPAGNPGGGIAGGADGGSPAEPAILQHPVGNPGGGILTTTYSGGGASCVTGCGTLVQLRSEGITELDLTIDVAKPISSCLPATFAGNPYCVFSSTLGGSGGGEGFGTLSAWNLTTNTVNTLYACPGPPTGCQNPWGLIRFEKTFLDGQAAVEMYFTTGGGITAVEVEKKTGTVKGVTFTLVPDVGTTPVSLSVIGFKTVGGTTAFTGYYLSGAGGIISCGFQNCGAAVQFNLTLPITIK